MKPASRCVRPLAGLLGLLAALAVLSPGRCAAQKVDPARAKALREGTHVFRRILFDNGLRPLGELKAMVEEDPSKTILIVQGNLYAVSHVPVSPRGLAEFVERGGAVLIAGDHPPGGGTAVRYIRDLAGVDIGPDTMTCPDPESCFHNLPYCPLLRPSESASQTLFKDRLQVATNVPSWLIARKRVPGSIAPLAYLPPGTVVESRGDLNPWGLVLEKRRRPPLFAVGGERGEGRVLVLADHSIFINEMMLPTDNNNVEFTYNVVDWLREGKKRDRVLFIEDGQVQTKFDIPLKSPNLSPEEAMKMLFDRRNQLLAEAEKGLVRLEEDDAFNRGLLSALERLGWPTWRIVRYLLVLATMLLGAYLFYRLGMRDRFRHDPTVPVLAPALGKTLPAAPLVHQRAEELLKHDNLSEPAADLTRRWFARLGIEPAGAEPAFTAQGSWWQRSRQESRLRRLWRLAGGRSRERVTAPQLWRLQRELDQLRAGWERGAWGVVKG
jgi:hypothetical protein